MTKPPAAAAAASSVLGLLAQVSGILPAAHTRRRPLVLLNDKRYRGEGSGLTSDKRAILNIDALAASIAAAYPGVDVLAVKFRDMPMVEQLQLMSAASVFVTTAGSSSLLSVFQPAGSLVILLGGPEDEDALQRPFISYTPFNELDR